MRATPAMPAIDELRPFDSCVTLTSAGPRPFLADDALGTLDRYHIAEALVHDNHARLIYPLEHGNQRVLTAVRGRPRLHPVWVLEPSKRPDPEGGRALVAEMIEEGVRVARLPMKRCPPMAWLWKDLCAALAERRVPCFLDFGGKTTVGNPSDTDIAGVRELALAHPELPLVLSHVMGGLGIHTAVLPLMYRLPNLYLDTTAVLDYWREAAREIGPGRVLFASAMPFTDPGILVPNVQYARHLDADAKRKICGDNLRRLIEAVR